MTVEEIVNEKLDAEIASWQYYGDTDLEYDMELWFDHRYPEGEEVSQPLSGDDIILIDFYWNIVEVQSHSDGMTGSKLVIRTEECP